MNTNTSGKETKFSDPARAAITQALEEISRLDGSRWRPANHDFRQLAAASSPSASPGAVSPGRRLAFGRNVVWSSIGFLAIVCVGAIVFAWQVSDDRIAKSTPMVPEVASVPFSAAAMKEQPVTTRAIPSIAATSIDKGSQPTAQPQIVPKPAEPIVLVPPEMTEHFHTLERQLTNLKQGIEQINVNQARLARESSELMGNFREAQEKLILRVGELASEIKAVGERAARDHLTAIERLRVDQEQLAKIGEQFKASQEQIDYQKAGARRVGRSAPPQPQSSNAPSTRKPPPKPPSPQARVSPAQSPRQSQTRYP